MKSIRELCIIFLQPHVLLTMISKQKVSYLKIRNLKTKIIIDKTAIKKKKKRPCVSSLPMNDK